MTKNKQIKIELKEIKNLKQSRYNQKIFDKSFSKYFLRIYFIIQWFIYKKQQNFQH